MEAPPGNHVPKMAISKRRVRLKFPFSQDWTIITLTSEYYIQFVEKSLFISTTRGAHELKIVPLKPTLSCLGSLNRETARQNRRKSLV